MDFLTYILNKAGALPHDLWDRKFLRDYRTGVGDLGALPDTHDTLRPAVEDNPPDPGTPWTDTDCDGIDDAWELADPSMCYAVDPTCCDDLQWATCDNDALQDCAGIGTPGYTDLEVFLHARAAELEGAVLFADEFEDRVKPVDWQFVEGDWNEVGGYLEGQKVGSAATALASGLVPACDSECSVAGTLQALATDADPTANVRLLGWVESVDPQQATFVSVSLRPFAGVDGQVVVEGRSAGAVTFTCTVEKSVQVGIDYDVRIQYRPSSSICAFDVYFSESSLDEAFLTCCGQSPPPSGTIGVGSFRSDVRAGRLAAVEAEP